MIHSKKIIIIGPAHPLRPGGITTFNERLCMAFIEAGHQCSIWSFSLQYPGFLFPGTSQFTEGPAPEGIAIQSAINSINPFNWITVGNRIKNLQPDIVVVRYWIPFMGPALGTILRQVKKNKKTRVVCIADNVIPHEHRPGDKAFTRYFIKPVDAFVVMSKQVLEDLKKFTNKPVSLLPHPLYDNFGESVSTDEARIVLKERFRLPIGKEDKLLVFFGLIRSYKGLDLLIDAMHQLETSGVRLLIAGEFYEDKKPYLEKIASSQFSSRIIIHDSFIAGDDVKYFICAGDVIVQPYKSATQSGVTPVAYHFEKPMIVTNVGGLPEMVPDGVAGIVADPNAASIAAAIDTFYKQEKDFYLNGLLAEKKKLSWEKLVEALINNV